MRIKKFDSIRKGNKCNKPFKARDDGEYYNCNKPLDHAYPELHEFWVTNGKYEIAEDTLNVYGD